MTSSKDDDYAKKMAEAKEKSAKAAEELRRQENERIAQDYQNAQMLKRRMEYAMAMEELRNKHILHKGTQQETTLWDEVNRLADEAMKPEQNSYQDYRASMMSLLNMFGKLNKAMNVSVDQTFGELYNKYVYEKNEDPIGKAWIKFKSNLRDSIKGDADIDLPTLHHNVTFTDGKLNVAPLTRKDGAPLVVYERDEKGDVKYKIDDKTGKPELDDKNNPIKIVSNKPHPANEAFKALIDAWLIENDYHLVAGETNVYINPKNGKYLDEDTFNSLKPSLAEFLKNPANAELTIEEEPQSPSYSMR
ncbi:hypothetical protein [Legionella longbeachae]|uniref:Membrane-associated HD superfamily hydrolase n=1 Tax=Legionella longbeachae serogroup 1 (strain NSW150) TaxID=661367 RepID=D3HSK4_LEGLN|nr:hypothetical protein [Legionella longbeachae]VEE02387.1 membrane-associated HD superfamily hydrolase [Legionella oakridgensis]HBD7398122.1 hypothetical protein [Legionella pneumophila]ARB91331.1 hypothetical protein A6J40_03615 [Legionella longbeachae]ARM32245.1 hypothetical protein B0B39_01265 [Legionella longbeachae]EEZ94973.1 conserved hypothetical protein [Legionella longbeachae D-4968]